MSIVLLSPVSVLLLQGLGEDGSGIVQTAWALLGLLAADCQDKVALRRGVEYLMQKQVRDTDIRHTY